MKNKITWQHTQKLIDLFQINSEDADLLKNSFVYKVQIHHSQNVRQIWLFCEENVVFIYNLLRNYANKYYDDELNKFLSRFTFSLFPDNINNKNQIQKVIKNFTIETFKYHFGDVYNLEINDISFEKETIIINCKNKSIHQQFCSIEKTLLDIICNHYNLNYKFYFSFEHNLITKEKKILINNTKNKNEYKKNNFSFNSNYDLTNIKDFFNEKLNFKGKLVTVIGKIIHKISRITKTKTNKKCYIIEYLITNDYKYLLKCQLFTFSLDHFNAFKNHNQDHWVKITGKKNYSKFYNENILAMTRIENNFSDIDKEFIQKITPNVYDNYDGKKRIELHCHTKMSAMDGICHAHEYIEAAMIKKHQAIAITDMHNCHVFPYAYECLKNIRKSNKDFKLIYGIELSLLDENQDLILVQKNNKNAFFIDNDYACVDLETTGLFAFSCEIIELAAKFGSFTDKLNHDSDYCQKIVEPTAPIPKHIEKLTHYTYDYLKKNGKSIETALPEFLKKIENKIIIAHNAKFDLSFLKSACNKLNLKFNFTFVDSLNLARFLFPNKKSYTLKNLAKFFKIHYDEEKSHTGLHDAKVLEHIWIHLINKIKKDFPNIKTIDELQKLVKENSKTKYKGNLYQYYHSKNVLCLVKNQEGMKDLYKLITLANTKNFYGIPHVFHKDIKKYRKNLLIICPGIYSDLHEALMLDLSYKEIKKIINFYDYIEINPPSNYLHFVSDLKINENDVYYLINKMIEYANNNKKMSYASGNTFYLYPAQKIARTILINSKSIGNKSHYLFTFNNRNRIDPHHHFKNTQELCDEFSFLGDSKLIHDLVINNTHIISDKIDNNLYVVLSGLNKPKISNSVELLKNYTYEQANLKFKNNIPKDIKNRIDNELKMIIKHGYDVIYWISKEIVDQSKKNGYLVGSRGSVGSSVVAFLIGITDVNPLPSYYQCSKCNFYKLAPKNFLDCGYDLPKIKCESCNSEKMDGHGISIPFETFLGFHGEKIPDIDLNFDSDYQDNAHMFLLNYFGKDYCYRVGTINTIKSATAYAFVCKYLETTNKTWNKSKINMMCYLLTSIKRTTGQHPGGIVVISKNTDVYDFTPVNFPADDFTSNWKTTHFAFDALHNNLLKFDILGHDDPKILRFLLSKTKINIFDIKYNDENVLKIFQNSNSFNIDKKYNLQKTGTLAIPEFGTKLVMDILTIAKPKSFADLIRISGLAHGTNVWANNFLPLIKNNELTLKQAITCRDDIMLDLIKYGLNKHFAFQIMESVRKGNGISEMNYETLASHNIPQWYIDACNKIEYMFPKAHAAAYVIMAWRIAWFKVYHPLIFYSVIFTHRIINYDYEAFFYSIEQLHRYIKIMEVDNSNLKQTSIKKYNLLIFYNLVLEFKLRNFEFEKVHLYKSDYNDFIVNEKNNTLLIPFKTIDKLGIEIAKSIVEERNKNHFSSMQELKKRTKINKNHVKYFNEFV